MTSHMRWWLAASGVLLALVVGYLGTRSRAIAFDQMRWQSAQPARDDLRYRMSGDLLRLMEVEHWDRSAALRRLGPDDRGDVSPNSDRERYGERLIYRLGRPRAISLMRDGFYLQIKFDKDDRFEFASVHVD